MKKLEYFLSGKCLENFINYCVENKEVLFDRLLADEIDVLDELVYLNKICIQALIIDFFDNNFIITSVNYENFGDKYFNAMVTTGHITSNLRSYSKDRNGAVLEAIKKANDYFNNNYQILINSKL